MSRISSLILLIVPLKALIITDLNLKERIFLDALASLDLKLSVSQSVIHLFQISFKASASTGLSDYFAFHHIVLCIAFYYGPDEGSCFALLPN